MLMALVLLMKKFFFCQNIVESGSSEHSATVISSLGENGNAEKAGEENFSTKTEFSTPPGGTAFTEALDCSASSRSENLKKQSRCNCGNAHACLPVSPTPLLHGLHGHLRARVISLYFISDFENNFPKPHFVNNVPSSIFFFQIILFLQIFIFGIFRITQNLICDKIGCHSLFGKPFSHFFLF